MTDGGAKLAAFVEQELKAERDRRVSIDARGQSVVTTSGSLVTLLAALGAFVTSQDKYQLPRAALLPLVVTLTLFAVAAFLGILATYNFAYRVADGSTLSAIPQHMKDSEEVANRNITNTNVLTVLTMRAGNNRKALLLLIAMFVQLGALVALATTLYVVLLYA